jgi:hypothetical protein
VREGALDVPQIGRIIQPRNQSRLVRNDMEMDINCRETACAKRPANS